MENRFYRSCFEIYDEKDSENLLKREFGRNICNDLQAWWFDQLIGGKRYKFQACYELFAQQERIAREAYGLDRRKISQIAFIVDEDSYHLISNESDHQMVELFNNYEIDKIGAPSDRYFKSDFLNDAMPDYKLYVFLNMLCSTAVVAAPASTPIKTFLVSNDKMFFIFSPAAFCRPSLIKFIP